MLFHHDLALAALLGSCKQVHLYELIITVLGLSWCVLQVSKESLS